MRVKYIVLGLWWLSSIVFIVDIFSVYLIHPTKEWQTLPGLCCPLSHRLFIMIHFIGGIIILLLGAFQFFPILRDLGIHKWIGRVYIVSCIITSIAGITFICLNGTVGGPVMSIAFAMYGALLLVFSIITWRYSYKKEYTIHQQWAIRTFILGGCSWIYRILYLLAATWGHNPNIIGYKHPIDYTFDWIFFILPLLICEIIFYTKRPKGYQLLLI